MGIRNVIRSILGKFGYEIRRVREIESRNGFELFQYRNSDGSFDYDRYKQIQTNGNVEKINNVWVKEQNIEFISKYIKEHLEDVNFGLCHGTRRGKEQEWFNKYLSCDVLGTEISETATQFPNTIQWDFHEVKPEWENSVDFIYSNSFDHSYDPEMCLNQWMSCLKKGGLCIIEHTSGHELATELDPFGAHISRMPYLVLTWGKGTYCAREILSAPSLPDSLSYIHFLIIVKL